VHSVPATPVRVLGEHRREAADPAIPGKASEQGKADVHHALGLRDHDGAAPEASQPVPLTRVVERGAVGFVLARVVLPDRREHGVGGVGVGAVEPSAPAREPRDQALAGGLVTNAALPVHQLP
jgi:hypothetical protein